MSELPNYKVEPAEHQLLSDNDVTPLRDEPVASPRIYTSNATGGTGGWESDDGEATTVIPKKEPLLEGDDGEATTVIPKKEPLLEGDDGEATTVIPKKEPLLEGDPAPRFSFFNGLMGSPRTLKDLKTEKPVDLHVATDTTNLNNLANGFTKREQLDDMDLENLTEARVVHMETESFADPNLQVLLEERARLLEEQQLLLGQEEPVSSSSNKKRKKHKKDKSHRHRHSKDGSKRSRRSSTPHRDQESRRSNSSQEKETLRDFDFTLLTNSEGGRSRNETNILESRQCINSDEENKSPSSTRVHEFEYLNNNKDGRFREGLSRTNEDERNCKKSESPKRQSYCESKRSQEYSRLPNAITHPVAIKEEPELEPPSLRDDEKGCIRLVDPSKLMQEIPKPPPPSLSYKEKQNLGIERAKLALAQLKLESSKASRDEFLMVNTISKLPVSLSYMTQGIFENPSPLQNNFNVAYKFNSICGAEINLAKWGLEALPAPTTHLLNVFGFDVDTLKRIEANTVTPQHILKLRKTAVENGELVIKTEDMISTGTGLYKNMSTQTTNQTYSQTMGTQTEKMEKCPENATFWLDPQFDIISLTQTQTNIMFALQELTESMPNSMWAEQFYKALQNALFIKRMALKDPRLTKLNTK